MSKPIDIRALLPVVERATILVCDDDAPTRVIIRHALSRLGHNCIEAEDGIAAQACCAAQMPSAAIVDMMMPRMNGVEFVSWLRKEHPSEFVPVLFLTALSEVENRVEAFAAGGDDYLTKPFHTREFQARVQALLRMRLAMEQLRERTVELERSRAALLEKERELVAARMAGAAAHAFGQPLTSILLHCHLIEKGAAAVPHEPRQIDESLAAIRSECQHLQGVLQELEGADPAVTESYPGGVEIVRFAAPPSAKKA